MRSSPATTEAGQPAFAPHQWQVQGSRYLCRRTPPAERTAGGVLLVEPEQRSRNDWEVLEAGPGRRWATGVQQVMWAQPGDRLLVLPHQVEHVTGEPDLAFLRDEEAAAILRAPAFELQPLNGWVLVLPGAWVTTSGSIALPDEYQQRRLSGRLLAYGRGEVQVKGFWAGIRKSIDRILSVPGEELLERTVHWGSDAEVLEVGDPVTRLLVRMHDLFAVEG